MRNALATAGFLLLFVSIPAPLIPEVLGNLATMADRGLLDLPQYHWGKEAHESHMRKIFETLTQQQDPAAQDHGGTAG